MLEMELTHFCLSQEELLRCTACCEPFHPFCLNYDELPQSAEVEREWVCRRCAACQVCGRADNGDNGDKLRCGKCLRASHSDCLQPSQRETIPGQDGGDESWVSLANLHLICLENQSNVLVGFICFVICNVVRQD